MNLSTLTAEQRLWGKVLCQMLLDAIEGPEPFRASPSGGEDKSEEYESRRISRGQVTDMDEAFCFACDAMDWDPEVIRDSYLAGNMTREGVYYVMEKLTNR
mgnify:CR=1 FL=1